MNYLYIDGDNIGLKIENSFFNNDENSLKVINNMVFDSIAGIANFLKIRDQEIIFSGADGIICKGPDVSLPELIDYIREISSVLTFSIGSGGSLRDAYIALRYAKSVNKNIGVVLENGGFILIDGIKSKQP